MFDDSKKKNKNASVSKIDSMPISTVIGTDILFKGDMQGDSIIRIDGKIEGNVSLKKGIVLGEKAQVTGNMESDHIVVYGSITGDILCQELMIKKTGVVNGDITTSVIEIEMGGKYNGKLNMSGASSELQRKKEKTMD